MTGGFCQPTVEIIAINTSGGYRVQPYVMPQRWLDEAEAKLILTVGLMQDFDYEKYLDSAPVELPMPERSKVNFEDYQ